MPTADGRTEWSPSSWRSAPIYKQDVQYPDEAALARVLDKIGSLPPLVSAQEIDTLRSRMAEVARGERFVLQGGDCAERFEDCTPEHIEGLMRVILQMSLIVIWGARIPVVRIGRQAGQYAKPRSSPTETLADGQVVLSYRGDNVNGLEIADRTPDPQRLLQGHFTSTATLNHIRALLANGFADLHRASWDVSHVKDSALKEEYQSIVERLLDAFDFMRIVGSGADDSRSLSSVEWYVSHEGLMLEYEERVTNGQYNLGTHFLWIGDRTRQLDGAHVEYFRGLKNPVGIKVGPSMSPEELVRLLDILDPNDELGKVSLITRFGHTKVADCLPPIIRAVQATGRKGVVWICDPLHGNTTTSNTTPARKTRIFDDVVKEFQATFEVHRTLGSHLGGAHLEMTGTAVTECFGGAMELDDLEGNYTTACDPRLNVTQALDFAFMIAKLHRGKKNTGLEETQPLV